MVRRARVVVPGVAHHVTQRGNNRQDIFFTDDDRVVYLKFLAEKCAQYGLAVHGYCLMTNHVHLLVVPYSEDALAKAVGRTHFRYTQYINMMHGRSGHLWQNRFYSCMLDDGHYLEAMRYVERNPVSAGVVRRAWRWRWSSARAHCAMDARPNEVLDLDAWRLLRIDGDEWRGELVRGDDELLFAAIRCATGTGRPLGSDSFISRLEAAAGRRLRALPHGRPRRS